MNKKIEFEYEGTKYILEYNRKSIQLMEANGFNMDEWTKKPMTMVDLAFKGLFLKNHSDIKQAKVEEIFALFKDKERLMQEILMMIDETYEPLFTTKKDDEGKNIEWKIV